MKRVAFTPAHRMAGFGLIELLVSMVIGMFGVLIMLQVLNVSEEQKRTTTSGNDAMNEGILALYAIQKDVRMSGHGISDPKILGCSLTLRAGVELPALAPVVINPGNIPAADANTDRLLVFLGRSYGTTQGDTVIGAGNTVQTPSAFTVNDWVVAAPVVRAAPCALTLDRVTNVAAGAVTLASGATAAVGATLFNLGQGYRAVGYAIRNGNLTTCDYTVAGVDCSLPGSWTSIADNIVSLRVQYGRDATAPAMDGVVDSYDQFNPTAANTLCDWSRVSAARMAVVARSALMERDDVTAAGGVAWEGSAADNPAGSTAAPVVLTANADWRKYRYRVFQSVVPLRNMNWMGVVTGC